LQTKKRNLQLLKQALRLGSTGFWSSELRNQFTGLKSIIDLNANNAATALSNAIAGTAVNPTVTTSSQSISNPPTQAQVLAIQNKINELITAITRAAP
jgi:hypothetical protein